MIDINLEQLKVQSKWQSEGVFSSYSSQEMYLKYLTLHVVGTDLINKCLIF